MLHRSFILLTISSFIFSASDNFIPKTARIRYQVDGTYDPVYYLKKEPTELENKQLERLDAKIANTAYELQKVLGRVIANNAHLVVAFPKEGSTIKLELKIMIHEMPRGGLSADRVYAYSSYIGRNNYSKEEEIEYAQFKNQLANIALNGCNSLSTALDLHDNLIHLQKNSCAIGLDIDLRMWLP